jgi:hypothetical protein
LHRFDLVIDPKSSVNFVLLPLRQAAVKAALIRFPFSYFRRLYPFQLLLALHPNKIEMVPCQHTIPVYYYLKNKLIILFYYLFPSFSGGQGEPGRLLQKYGIKKTI